MQTVHGWEDTPASLRGGAIAIGNFDGVHRGHQAVLSAAIEAARALSAPSGAMIFEPHPRKFFQPGKPVFQLTPLERKLALLDRFGLDFTAVLPFDERLASLPAAEFAARVIVAGFGAAHVVTGYDFFFGKGRDGTPQIMRDLGARLGFSVTTVEAAGGGGEIFSSTRIRELLAEGDPRAAAEMLGHRWRVKGVVQSGAGRGTGLGFPTANIHLEDCQALKHGIYAVRVYCEGARHYGAAYLGTRPTFDAGPPVLEIFLLDFEGNLYGRTIEVEFVDFIRGDAKFRSGEALSAQMKADCDAARIRLEMAETDAPLNHIEGGNKTGSE